MPGRTASAKDHPAPRRPPPSARRDHSPTCDDGRALSYVPPLLEVALTVYCLLDAIRSDRATIRYLPKLAWVLIIVLVPIVGDVAWLVAGRPRHDTDHGPQEAQLRPRGPDDDPDFLKSI